MTTAYESSRQVNEDIFANRQDAGAAIKKRKEESYNQFITITQDMWNEMRIDQRFYAGDSTLYREQWGTDALFDHNKFNFNIIRTPINMVAGHQRKHRKSSQIYTRATESDETSEQHSDVLNWAFHHDNVYTTISEAFEAGALVTGFSLLALGLDRTFDIASGDLKVSHLAYNSFMVDPFFRKQDMSDCSFVWTRKWVTRDEASFLLPESRNEIQEMQPFTSGSKDQRFYYMPENYQLNTKDMFAYDEYYYQTTRKAVFLFDTETQESMEWEGEDENLEVFLNLNPNVRKQKLDIPTVNVAISVNDRVFYDGRNRLNIDTYPFVPIIGYWDPDNPLYSWRFQGLARGMRDAQYLFTRRKIIELATLESQINSGMKVMEGSLVDDNDVLKKGQGQPIFIKRKAPQGMDSVQMIPPPVIPPTTLQLSQELSSLTRLITGINEEMLGMDDGDKAGITTMLRQGAGLVTLEKIFDQLDLSQKILTEKSMQIIQRNFTVGKIRKILNKEPAEEFYSKLFRKYNCVIAEGAMTETQQKLEFLQYFTLVQMGVPIPPDMLAAKAQIQGKVELQERLRQDAEAQAKAEEQKAQLELQALQTDNLTKQSFSEAQHALAGERVAKIQEERNRAVAEQNRAEEEKTNSILNLVRVFKELDGLDLDNLQKKIEIIKDISGETTRGEEEIKETQPEGAEGISGQ